MNRVFFCYMMAVFSILIMTSCSVRKAAPVSSVEKAADVLVQLEDSLRGGHLGLLVMEAETGKVLAEHNSHKYFVPASNTKLLSLYAGLKYLGDSLPGLYYYDAGDTMYVQPTGDPTLLARDYKIHPVMNWLAGVNKPVVFDASNWRAERYGRGWTWSDYQASYQQERSALPVYGNMMPVRFTAKGDSVNFEGTKIWAVTPHLVLGENTADRVWQMKPESLAYFHTPQSRQNIINRNYAANGYEVNYNGRDTAFAAYIPFVTHGIKTGVEILRARLNKSENQFIVRNVSTGGGKLFNRKPSTIYSQPLDSMLRPMMHRSDNFFAEQTLLMASQAFLGFMSERAMIDTLLKTDLKGMPDKPVWVDGSGLSRYNLFSPADFVWLLDKLRNEFPIERIKAILPTGNAGTLTNYYTALNGKIFAKTGTLSGQVALSGYLYAKSGKLLLFSALVNNHNMEAPMVRRMVERYLMGVWEGN
jgi:serine-type D-Ala-D-Ala carboxypeptidase/endopeptidase (penicillin-binding protein 4)